MRSRLVLAAAAAASRAGIAVSNARPSPSGRVHRSRLQRICSHQLHVRTGFHGGAASTHPNDLVTVGSEDWDNLSTKYAGSPGDEYSYRASCTLIVID